MPSEVSGSNDFAVVTRTEIVDHVAPAFVSGQATTPELLAAAQASGARPEVLAVLDRLPNQRYVQPHDLWSELPDLPIGG